MQTVKKYLFPGQMVYLANCLPHKHEVLSSTTSTGIRSQMQRSRSVIPPLERQKLEALGTCWMSSVAKSESSRFCHRLGLKKKKNMVDGVWPESPWIPDLTVLVCNTVLHPSDSTQLLRARGLHNFITLLMEHHHLPFCQEHPSACAQTTLDSESAVYVLLFQPVFEELSQILSH